MTTKKSKPSPRRIIERPRLMRLLSESPARIKLLVAPAGYGKTTLARQWLEGSGREYAWYSCQDASADVAVLVEALVDALQRVAPGWGAKLITRLHGAQSPAREVVALADALRGELIRWPEGFWLAIDEYDLLAAEPTAESLVRELTNASSVNLVVCGRRRPAWAVARQIVYGEILEVGRGALTMTAAETELLLGSDASTRSDLVPTEGWPAVVGLAAMTGTDVLRLEQLPSSIYDFLADEIFGWLSDDARHVVRLLAAAAPIRVATLLDAGDAVSEEAMREASELGLAEVNDDVVTMHPLIRGFVLGKAPPNTTDLEPLFDRLIEDGAWDGAFRLAERALRERMDDLIRAALPDLLARSHIQTLEKWGRFAEDTGPGPAAELVRAEVAFREGQFFEAKALARSVVQALGDADELKIRALLVLGRAAHLASDEEEALEAYRRARLLAGSPTLRESALWGEIGAAVDLELPEAETLFEEAQASVTTYFDRVNLANKRLVFEARTGELKSVESARGLARNLWRLPDPLLRASFLNSLATSLSLAAEYDDSLRISRRLMDEAEEQGLEFVSSYALGVRAVALAGLRRHDEALVAAAEARRLATSQGDRHSILNSEAIQSRIYFSLSQYNDALDALVTAEAGAIPSMASEIAACRGLALAAVGRIKEARAAARLALNLSRAIEPRVLASGVEVICAVHEGGADAEAALRTLVQASSCSGNIDCLLVVCRGAPHVLRYGSVETLDRMRALLRQSGDEALHEVVVRVQDQQLPGFTALSPREREVGALLVRGRSNADIARILYISIATAKIHVRHIYEKLGVSSRTEAALRLAAGLDRSGDLDE